MTSAGQGKEAFIRYEGTSIRIRSPYDADFVRDIKLATRSRRFDRDSKEWMVDVSERDVALSIARRYFLLVIDDRSLDKSIVEQQADLRWDKEFKIEAGDIPEIWVDGACVMNPGPGGYAVFINNKGHVRELAGGFSLTTNNRMELMGPIVALESLEERCSPTIYSDSKYLVDAMTLGWAKSWQAKDWKLRAKGKAKNPDLWQRLLDVCERHEVKFKWLKGHAESPANTRCDQLAEAIARKPGLPEDRGFKPASE